MPFWRPKISMIWSKSLFTTGPICLCSWEQFLWNIHVLISWYATTWQGSHVGGQYNTIFSPRIYMEIEFSSQGREMHLFLITNMAAVMSRGNQQHVCKSSGENYWFVFFLCEYCSLSFLSFVLRHLAIALVGNTEKLRGNRRSPENLIPRPTMQAWMMEAMNIKTGPFKNRFDRLYCSLWIHKKSI